MLAVCAPSNQLYDDCCHESPTILKACVLCCRQRVQDKLQAAFHGFAALAQQDWQSYALMASLAGHQYGLLISAPALPPQTADQGKSIHSKPVDSLLAMDMLAVPPEWSWCKPGTCAVLHRSNVSAHPVITLPRDVRVYCQVQ